MKVGDGFRLDDSGDCIVTYISDLRQAGVMVGGVLDDDREITIHAVRVSTLRRLHEEAQARYEQALSAIDAQR